MHLRHSERCLFATLGSLLTLLSLGFGLFALRQTRRIARRRIMRQPDDMFIDPTGMHALESSYECMVLGQSDLFRKKIMDLTIVDDETTYCCGG